MTPLPLVRQLGTFDLDPCGFAGHPTATRLIIIPEDGLTADWYGRVWLNPPYGKRTAAWLTKLQKHGNGIALVFGRLETRWLQPFLHGGFFQLTGRISFLDDSFQKQSNAGAPSILIPFGRKNIGSILSSDLDGIWFK